MKALKVLATILVAIFVTSCSSELKEENQTKVYNCLVTKTITSSDVNYTGINATNAEVKFIGDLFFSFEITDEVVISGHKAALKTSVFSQKGGVYHVTLIYTYGSNSSTSYINYDFTIVDGKVKGNWSESFPENDIKNFGEIVSGQLIVED